MLGFNFLKSLLSKVQLARLLCLIISFLFLVTNVATAETPKEYLVKNFGFYSPDRATCSLGTGASVTGSTNNLDYAGRPILTDAQLQAIQQNQSIYQQAAQQIDIPWQMLAVVHLREHGLEVSNPANGQGIYQFADKRGGPYPEGPVNQQEFLRQTVLAAEFLKGKAAANSPNNRDLTATSPPDVIKDTFFGYNGRAPVYAQQAASLGFDASTQAFEGSPYVMNKADARRDPEVNKTGWGQVKTDNGPIVYPANYDYGAFVTYASLAGLQAGGCVSGNGGKVVEIAKQEFAKGVKEEPLGSDRGPIVDIYNKGSGQAWCLYFVYWVFGQAGIALDPGYSYYVPTFYAYAVQKGTFHPKSEAGFVPQPGDIAIFNENLQPYPGHANIVIAYNAANRTFSTIGGNENNGVQQNSSISMDMPALTGFARVL